MKTKHRFLKWLAMLLLVIASSLGAMAQQTACPGTKHYSVTPSAANMLNWSVSPGISGVDWTISDPSLSGTDILWANVGSATVYTVTFKETNLVTSCYTERTITVTVNPLPVVAAIGGGAANVCVGAVTPAFTDATAGGVWTIVPGTGTANITAGGVVTGVTAGTVNVTYTVTNGSGCVTSVSKSLIVNVLPNPSEISY